MSVAATNSAASLKDSAKASSRLHKLPQGFDARVNQIQSGLFEQLLAVHAPAAENRRSNDSDDLLCVQDAPDSTVSTCSSNDVGAREQVDTSDDTGENESATEGSETLVAASAVLIQIEPIDNSSASPIEAVTQVATELADDSLPTVSSVESETLTTQEVNSLDSTTVEADVVVTPTDTDVQLASSEDLTGSAKNVGPVELGPQIRNTNEQGPRRHAETNQSTHSAANATQQVEQPQTDFNNDQPSKNSNRDVGSNEEVQDSNAPGIELTQTPSENEAGQGSKKTRNKDKWFQSGAPAQNHITDEPAQPLEFPKAAAEQVASQIESSPQSSPDRPPAAAAEGGTSDPSQIVDIPLASLATSTSSGNQKLESPPPAITSSSGRVTASIDSPSSSASNESNRASKSQNVRQAHQPETESTNGLSAGERVRLIQRISRSFARLDTGGGEVQLRLHPPQLGSLNVRVRLEGKNMTAQLTTESHAAREVILESLPVLRTRLAEQGFEIQQFHVDVANGSLDMQTGGHSQASSQGFEQSNSQRQLSQAARSNLRAVRTSNSYSAAMAAHQSTNAISSGKGIDVKA